MTKKEKKQALILEEMKKSEAQGFHIYEFNYHLITRKNEKRLARLCSMPKEKNELLDFFETLYQKPRNVVESLYDATERRFI